MITKTNLWDRVDLVHLANRSKAAGSIEKLKEEDKAFKKEILRLVSRFKG